MRKFQKLIGQELSINDLSNELEQLGCEEIHYFEDMKELMDAGNMVVATDDAGWGHIKIYYDVTIMPSEDESVMATYVKITKIEEI